MSIYSGISITVLQARLAEAQDAFHALNTGQQTVSVATGDKKITFTAAEVDRLRAYVRDLQTAIAVASGAPDPRSRPAVATWTR